MSKNLILIFLITIIGFALLGSTAEVIAQTAQIESKQTYTVRKGTPEFDEIERFLANSDVNGTRGIELLTANGMPTYFTVTRTTRSSSKALSAAVPAPPAPLPGGGAPGDIFSLTTCAGGWNSTWTYVWTVTNGQGEWKLTGYSTRFVRRCEIT